MIALDEGGFVQRRGHEQVAGADALSVGAVAGDAALVGESSEFEDLVVLGGGGKGQGENWEREKGKGSLHLISGRGRLR